MMFTIFAAFASWSVALLASKLRGRSMRRWGFGLFSILMLGHAANTAYIQMGGGESSGGYMWLASGFIAALLVLFTLPQVKPIDASGHANEIDQTHNNNNVSDREEAAIVKMSKNDESLQSTRPKMGETTVKEKESKLEKYVGVIGAIAFIVFGTIKLWDWATAKAEPIKTEKSTSATAVNNVVSIPTSKKEVVLTPDEQQLVEKTKARPILQGLEATSPGVDIYNGVTIKYIADQFRENFSCQITFRGKQADGQDLPPRLGLYLDVGIKSAWTFYAESFLGPSKSVRLTFDQDPTFFELKPSSGGDVQLTATQSLIEKASVSKIAKLNHGFSGVSDVTMISTLRRTSSAANSGSRS